MAKNVLKNIIKIFSRKRIRKVFIQKEYKMINDAMSRKFIHIILTQTRIIYLLFIKMNREKNFGSVSVYIIFELCSRNLLVIKMNRETNFGNRFILYLNYVLEILWHNLQNFT